MPHEALIMTSASGQEVRGLEGCYDHADFHASCSEQFNGDHTFKEDDIVTVFRAVSVLDGGPGTLKQR